MDGKDSPKRREKGKFYISKLIPKKCTFSSLLETGKGWGIDQSSFLIRFEKGLGR